MTGPGLQARIAGWLSHDTHPAVQFAKYVMAGGIGTVVFYVATLVGVHYFQAGQMEKTAVFSAAYLMANGPAFCLSLAVVYPLNRLFVFRPGRHKSSHEMAYFTGFAVVGNILGAFLAAYLMGSHGIPAKYATLGNIITSVLVNYAGRKFFVFKG